MQIADAVKERIIDLCHDNNISINKLAVMSGQTQSTLQSLIDGKSKKTKLLTLVRVCDSLNITLKEFFDNDLFNNIDTEL